MLAVYENGSKLKNLSYLACTVTLEYDRAVPENAQRDIAELFARKQLVVEKRGKNGMTEQDLIPMIRRLSVRPADANTMARAGTGMLPESHA